MFFIHNNDLKNNSDEKLMLQQSKGNKKAFALLYERYFDKLVWYANDYVHDMTKAEDIVQDVFMKLIASPEKFDETKTFSTWIYTVTANRAKNILRHEKTRLHHVQKHKEHQTIGTSKLHHNIDTKHLHQQLQTVYASLSDKEKTMYALRFEQQLSIKEIALHMNIPEGSVKSGIFYLLKKYTTIQNYFTHEN